ncbi:hypothetical protein CBL_01726 [Carabus blaptoides fortunei]
MAIFFPTNPEIKSIDTHDNAVGEQGYLVVPLTSHFYEQTLSQPWTGNYQLTGVLSQFSTTKTIVFLMFCATDSAATSTTAVPKQFNIINPPCKDGYKMVNGVCRKVADL